MDRQDRRAALVLRQLPMEVSELARFDGRRTFQKIIYLLQEGRHWAFGFHFNLYIRGPYSPDLADAGYRLLEGTAEIDEATKGMALMDTCLEDIASLGRSFSQPASTLDADLLELAATIHFLVHRTFRYLEDYAERIQHAREWVAERKSALAFRFDEACEKLAALGMIPARSC